MTTAITGPTLMFQHCLDELKGWPDEAALDFDAYLSSNVTVDPVYGGMVVHVNRDPLGGKFELGIGPSDMGIFLLQGSHELDVNNAGGNQWYAIAPTGKMSGLVAAGGFELESTEFDQTASYLPGDQLTSPTEAMITTGTDKTAAGRLFNKTNWPGAATAGTAVSSKALPVCAVVSRMNHINHHRVPVVSFWPVYIPCMP
jgi:hypothetical protein